MTMVMGTIFYYMPFLLIERQEDLAFQYKNMSEYTAK